jgi:hypothetical protein
MQCCFGAQDFGYILTDVLARVPYFGALYLPNQAKPVEDPLIKVVACFEYNKLYFWNIP